MDTNMDVLLKAQRVEGHVLLIPMNHTPGGFIFVLGVGTGVGVCGHTRIAVIFCLDQKTKVFIGGRVIDEGLGHVKAEAFEVTAVEAGMDFKTKIWHVVHFDCFSPVGFQHFHHLLHVLPQRIILGDV